MISLAALTMQAQRCAVLEFKANVGVSQQDVDGISAIFITYFQPAGYTMVERTQIDKAIDEQGFQRSRMTESQTVRIGQILNVSKIVIGDVNIIMGQYNVDVRVINVETGTIAATEGATFDGSSYRSTMHGLAQKLASKMAITYSGTTPNYSQTTSEYVDLGLPSGTLWKRKNETGFFHFDAAISRFGEKIPSNWQWEELIESCRWTWTGGGYKVVGPSGESIFLPAMGCRLCDGELYHEGIDGDYWSSTPKDSRYAWEFIFGSTWKETASQTKCLGASVRLIKE